MGKKEERIVNVLLKNNIRGEEQLDILIGGFHDEIDANTRKKEDT